MNTKKLNIKEIHYCKYYGWRYGKDSNQVVYLEVSKFQPEEKSFCTVSCPVFPPILKEKNLPQPLPYPSPQDWI